MIEYPHIEERDQRYFIKGKHVRVASLAYAWNQGASPETIAQKFSSLTYAEIYAAIAFYLDHRALIDQQDAEDYDLHMAERAAQREADPARYRDWSVNYE